jgi:diguanylate cyclase (GGDEF)-like protein
MGDHKTRAMEIPVLPPDDGSTDTTVVLVQVYPHGPNLGRRITLAGPKHLVGRLPELDVAIEEDQVSRNHAQFFRDPLGWWLEDLGSTNGSFVNDQRVTRQQLKDGDMVRFGSVVLRFLSGSNIEARYHEEIYNMSMVDAMTGAHNKRSFLEHLDREVARSLRYNVPLSLVLFDLDHFKAVNDTHGHLAGDAVLKEMARRVLARLRKGDMFARYGGEEWASVLACTGHAGALIYAENVRKLISGEPFRLDGVTLTITVSGGVAELQPPLKTGADLIARADARLYEAKESGRNRIMG